MLYPYLLKEKSRNFNFMIVNRFKKIDFAIDERWHSFMLILFVDMAMLLLSAVSEGSGNPVGAQLIAGIMLTMGLLQLMGYGEKGKVEKYATFTISMISSLTICLVTG